MMPNQMAPVRKNAFHCLFFLDLSNEEHITILSDILSIIEQRIPIRFGIVPIITSTSLDDPSTSLLDAGNEDAHAFG
jgi:hypothetical protein